MAIARHILGVENRVRQGDEDLRNKANIGGRGDYRLLLDNFLALCRPMVLQRQLR